MLDKNKLAAAVLLLSSMITSAGVHASQSSFQQPAPVAPVDAANWKNDARIQAIRKMVDAVNAALTRRHYKISQRKFEFCEPYKDTLRRIAVDRNGIVRSYVTEAGSEDSALKWEYYYDESGRLRFVFISGGAVNESQLEHRIYFAEDGKRIWEEHKYVKGPGYTFPEIWPDEDLKKTKVARAFSATSACPEILVRHGRKRR